MRPKSHYLSAIALLITAACYAPPTRSNDRVGWIPPVTHQRINIAHRGASGHAPENTIAAFDLALQLDADYFELDVQRTADDVTVVLHDATLDRTARGPRENCTGPVVEKTLAQIRTCEVGGWFNERFPDRARPEFVGAAIPTLDEVFRRYGKSAGYLIELKNPETYPGLEAQVVELLRTHALDPPNTEVRQVILQSFSAPSVRRLHALDPNLALVQLIQAQADPDSLRRSMPAIRDYALGIGPAKGTVDVEMVSAAHENGLVVFPYTVDEPDEMEALLASGVDGVITNFPDRLGALLRR